MQALALLAGARGRQARRGGRGDVRDLATSDDAGERRAAAALFAARGNVGHDIGVLARSPRGPRPEGQGRSARCGRPLGRHVPRARAPGRRRPRRASPRGYRRASAVRRLGPRPCPWFPRRSPRDAPRRPPLVRAAAMLATEHGVDVVAPALRRPRSCRRARSTRIARGGGRASIVVPSDVLDHVFHDATDARHARVCRPRRARGIRTARSCVPSTTRSTSHADS